MQLLYLLLYYGTSGQWSCCISYCTTDTFGSVAAISFTLLWNLLAVQLLYLLVYNGYSWQRSCYISNFTMEPPGSAVAVSLIVQVYYGTSWQCSCCISYSTTDYRTSWQCSCCIAYFTMEPLGCVAAVYLNVLLNILAVKLLYLLLYSGTSWQCSCCIYY